VTTFPEAVEHLIRSDEVLAPHTWLRIGGPARYFAEPTSREELVELVRAAAQAELPVRVLGGGSNLLVREAGFSGLVVSIAAAEFSQITVEGDRVRSGGGARLSHVINWAVAHGLAGIEHLVGIPGTLGGAICGNAGTQGGDIGQTVVRLELLSRSGEIYQREGSSLHFSHRQSDVEEMLILEAELALEANDARELTKRMQGQWIMRKAQQPMAESRVLMPFVDPVGATAGSLIDQVGLRGARSGAAAIDSRRPEFIVAHEGTTSDDVLRLVEKVREQVARQVGVDLQLAMKIW
jgi:UDP-N-acetylmuramate dehydrogenase